MTIKEIKEILAQKPINPDILTELQKDSRKGVQNLLISYHRKQEKLAAKKSAFLQRFSYEKKYWDQNQFVAGVDEVGRGPLAGPVVTAAVILDDKFNLIEVNDSKKLSPHKRLELFPKILKQAVSVSVGLANSDIIDEVNIYEADRIAMAHAVMGLKVKPDALLVDAMNVPLDIEQTSLIKGDAKSNSIAAASIVAKVFRDGLMDAYGERYPEYNFKHNAGYGTKDHLEALRKFGPTPIHRMTFAPVKNYKK